MANENGVIRNEPKDKTSCRETMSGDWGVSTNTWLYSYNEAMYLWLSHIKLERPEEPYDVPVLFQTPERAFAEHIRPTVNDVVDLPIISFTFTGASFDQTRYMAPSFLIWDKYQQGDKWILRPKPTPWNYNYIVTVWARFQEDLDVIAYRLLSRFTPHSYLRPWNIPSRISVESMTDTSTLEPGTDTDRILRNDYSLKVEGWMPLPSREVGKIREIDVVLTNDNNGTVPDPADGIEIINNGTTIKIIEGSFDIQTDTNGATSQVPRVILGPEYDKKYENGKKAIP